MKNFDAEFLLDSATGGNDTFVFGGAFGSVSRSASIVPSAANSSPQVTE
jgi:hypothetical protein